MATADELLATASETETVDEILTVNLNTRVISIPASLSVLGVESDDDVKRLQFKIPRFYGEFDLSEFHIRVNFKNASNNGDVYPVKDVTTTEDTMTFSWLVDRVAFKRKGDVKFSLCLKKYDSNGVVIKEFNTTFTSLPVLEGLETSAAVVENNPSAFDTVLFRLYAVEAATGNGQNGYYSVVKVSEEDIGTVFTIVNHDGTTVATVLHGYTPIKGVDYWTEEEKIEITQTLGDQTQKHINSWAPRTATVTLPVSGWSENQQTISVDGVTETNLVVLSPEPTYENFREYSIRGIRAVSQSENALTFSCVTVPNTDIVVNVAVYYSARATDNIGITVTDDDNGNVTIFNR